MGRLSEYAAADRRVVDPGQRERPGYRTLPDALSTRTSGRLVLLDEPEGQREGEWIQTFSGGKFWPLQPRARDLRIVDIAHHLSMICRFTGAVRRFYSVAEHCCHVHDLLPEPLRAAGLLHDASEAYLCDLARPVKYGLGAGYREAERRIMDVVACRYKLDFPDPAIKAADNAMLGAERLQALNEGPAWTRDVYDPAPVELRFWAPEEAEKQFLERWLRIVLGDGSGWRDLDPETTRRMAELWPESFREGQP